MIADPDEWEQRGQYWYRRASGAGPYEWRLCQGCNEPALLLRSGKAGLGKYCSVRCRAQDKSRPVTEDQRFGRGVVIAADVGTDRFGGHLVRLRCDCGQEYTTVRTKLWDGNTESCGCLAREQAREHARQLGARRGEESATWKGDEAGYHSLHQRVYRLRGKAGWCVLCGYQNRRADGYYDWAFNNLGQPDDPWAYMRLCKSCHGGFDGAVRMMQKPIATYWRPCPRRRLKKKHARRRAWNAGWPASTLRDPGWC